MISIIVCVNEAWYMGKNNDLMYHISNDLKRFKEITSVPNSYVFMGSKTWESLPRKPLPNRTNVVFTRNKKLVIDGVQIEHDVDKVINHLTQTGDTSDKKIFVIGGAEIIGQFAPYADRIYLTMVHDNAIGDTYLNNCFLKQFKEISREKHLDEKLNLEYSYINYIRKEGIKNEK